MKTIKEMNLEELEEVTLLFSNWLKNYTHEVIVKVMGRREEIVNNEFTMNLLRELYKREEEERKEFNYSIDSLLRSYDDFKKYDPHNHVLEHSKSYRDVLHDMYI